MISCSSNRAATIRLAGAGDHTTRTSQASAGARDNSEDDGAAVPVPACTLPRLEAWDEMPEFRAAPTGESLARRIDLLVWHCGNPYSISIEGDAAEVRRGGVLVDDDEAEAIVLAELGGWS